MFSSGKYNEEYLRKINKVFIKNNSLIMRRGIIREADWQTWLYCDLRDEFIDNENVLVLLEGRIKKGNNSFVWFSPDKYDKKKELLDKNCIQEIDSSGWVKVSFDNIQSFNSKLVRALEEESLRRFYVDVLIKDLKENEPIAIIEMKFHKNLDESFLDEDVKKLKRIKSVVNEDCFLLAVGYCLKKNKFISIPV